MTARALALLLAFGALVASPDLARAQSATEGSFHYAFATQIGSGIYRVNGNTMQIYRLNVPIRLYTSAEKGWSMSLRLPATFGFYNFDFADVIESGLPENFGTLALVPAVEFAIPARPNWELGPFGGFGIGKDFQGGDLNYIYAVGARSLAAWALAEADVRLANRLVYTGYLDQQFNYEDDLAFLESGVDVRQPTGLHVFGRELDGAIYGINYLYMISPDLLVDIADDVNFRTEWEIGMTVGLVEEWRLLGIKMPRLGLGYRFGTGASLVRFVVGYPFPIESPREQGEAGFELQ